MLTLERRGEMVDTVLETPPVYDAAVQEKVPTFDELLAERDMLVAYLPLVGRKTDEALGEAARKGVLEEAFADIVIRVYGETDIFKDYEELGLLEPIATEGNLGQIGDTTIVWNAKTPGGTIAVYRPSENKIYTSQRMPNRTSLVISLVKDGSMPDNAITLAHEITHVVQSESGDGIPYDSIELCEAQALRTADGQATEYNEAELVSLIKNFANKVEHPDIKKLDLEKFKYGLLAVDCLRAFGLTVREIADILVKPGEWDPNTKAFLKVREYIENSALQLGLDGDQLDEFVKYNVVELQIEKLKAKHIAQEELLRLIRQ